VIKVSGNDSFGVTVDHQPGRAFRCVGTFHTAQVDLAGERLVRAEQELAGRSGRARKMFAKPGRRQTNGWRAALHIRAQKALPGRHTGR